MIHPARRLLRRATAVAGAAAVAALAAAAPATAGAAGAVSTGAVSTGADPSVQLLSQTPSVEGQGTFRLRIQPSAATPSTGRVQVAVFRRLVTRTDFQAAATGSIVASPFYLDSAPLGSLPPDPAGGVDVDLPVDAPTAAGAHFGKVAIGEPGVFPVQVSVVNSSGLAEGSPLTTFLVYASGPAATTGYQPLSVALVVPFSTAPSVGAGGRIEAPNTTESARLSGLAAAVDQDTVVHAGVLASPLTVGSLVSSTSPTDRATLSSLAGVPSDGLVQVLPSTYSPASLDALVGAGLGSEVDRQLSAGSAQLASVFGTAPSSQVWVAEGSMSQASLGALVRAGVRQLVLPSYAVAPLPEYDTQTTFASPTGLSYGQDRLTVMAADSGITGDFVRSEPPVLAANVLLAELAMIQAEAPGISGRGIVVMPPPGWVASPQFVATLLQGLEGDPLLSATTVSGLFQAVGQPRIDRPLAGSTDAGAPGTAGPSDGPGKAEPGTATPLSAAAILGARSQLSALIALMPSQKAHNSALASQLLTAESALVSGPSRAQLLGAIGAAVARARRLITFPPSSSITLTSTKGDVPLTVLSSVPDHPQVELRLSSQRLIFRPYAPAGGRCSAPNPTTEVCQITLSRQNTTLNVPVETRSSGVFPLDVALYSAGGGLLLAHDQDTVRSSAVSQVAIALMIVAVLSLAVWWGRDLRRGRRPASLAPSPAEEEKIATSVTAPHLSRAERGVSPLHPNRGPS